MDINKIFLKLLLGIVAWLLWSPCMGQKKYEREYSIKPNAVPRKAMEFVTSSFTKVKVNWYREESLTGKTIEAKLKSSRKRYSIEFDEAGNIQDVEILTGINSMNGKGRNNLEDTLSATFSRYKIDKIQVQWRGSAEPLKESILQNKAVNGVLIRYELVVKGSRGKIQKYFEVLTEIDGTIVRMDEIVQRNTDNLIY
jgi:hypothetical protein